MLFHKRNDLVGIDFQLNCVERRHRDLRRIQLTDQFSSIVHNSKQRTGVVGQLNSQLRCELLRLVTLCAIQRYGKRTEVVQRPADERLFLQRHPERRVRVEVRWQQPIEDRSIAF